MRKWLITLIVLGLLLIPIVGRAQGEISLDTLEVRLWPEYDAPEMLVIYNFDLPTNTALPADVSFRIPAAAGKAYGFGYYPENGGVPVQENYAQRVDGGWLVVSFTMRSLAGTLEYYDPALSKSSRSRHFEFLWPGDYDINAMTINFQQPVASRDVKLSPAAATTTLGQNELTNHLVIAGAQEAGKTYLLTLDYQKDTDSLSVADMSVEAASPLPDGQTATWLPWAGGILAALGLALVVGVIVWYVTTTRQAKSAPQRGHKRARSATSTAEASTVTPTGDASEGIYCHQCGRRAGGGDRFCRSCGTQLRVD